MCMGATCPDCSKKTWRGCGKHVPNAMAGIDEADWCACEPKVEFDGKMYPRCATAAAAAAAPSSSSSSPGGEQKKGEGK